LVHEAFDAEDENRKLDSDRNHCSGDLFLPGRLLCFDKVEATPIEFRATTQAPIYRHIIAISATISFGNGESTAFGA